MRLPTLSTIIISQAVIWCIAGASVHGPMILLYPLSWLVIGACFYFHNKAVPIQLGEVSVPSDEQWANSKKPNAKQTPGENEPEKITAGD